MRYKGFEIRGPHYEIIKDGELFEHAYSIRNAKEIINKEKQEKVNEK